MKVKICMKEVDIKISDLSEPTVKALVDAIVKETKDSSVEPENVKVFLKSTKLDISKKLEEEGVTDDSVLFTYIKKNVKKSEHTETKTTQTQRPPNAPNPNSFGNPGAMGGMPNMGMGGMGGVSPDLLKSLLNDPQMVEQSINMAMPNATEEQKQMMRQQFKMLHDNPEMMNMAMQQFNQGGMGMPGMSNMGGMGMSPGMYPNMYNQGMMPNMGGMSPGMQQTPPPNGPCSHGFYPLHVVEAANEDTEGKLETLFNMGFTDRSKNKMLLLKHGGDLEATIDELTKK